ncbi:MAG: site-specific DNA-methyltransferase [Muribaculaceae bacterium]|nr:site-specific DNA-methyltransferase [Muribaculaceae bacterium]
MEKLKLHSMDGVTQNVERIAALFPNCVTERKGENGEVERAIDFDLLRQELSRDIIDSGEERYQFTWPGKREAIRLANAPTNCTLRPVREDSVDFDNTQNLYIEGDNLEVLKLLRETYLGKVKMIYIDPPYNTGNDFVYEDDFTESYADYKGKSGMFDEDGNMLLDNYERNTESNGRFHTDWLNLMYPRLKVARDLLADDGVIFISIDDNEVENLVKMGCEVFGESNFIGPIVIKSNPRGSMSTAEIANVHEYVVVFAKNRMACTIIGDKLSEEMESEYQYTDEIGKYRLLGLRMRGGFWRRTDRPKLFFPIFVNPTNKKISLDEEPGFTQKVYPIQPSTGIEGTWRWSYEKILNDKNFLVAKSVTRNGEVIWDIYQKDYLERDGGRRTKTKSIWDGSEVNYQNGTEEIKNLLGNSSYFDYSKPFALISHLIDLLPKGQDDIVLDFFSGSATTAHAVMQLNAEDGGHRKFIMVQLPEVTDENSEAYKAGYANICEIGKERIRRAGKKIKAEHPEAKDLDIGFRVLRLDSSNMEDVFYLPKDTVQADLFSSVDNVKTDRSSEDLLFQIMLELGISLSSKIESEHIHGKEVYFVEQDFLIACFDEGINEDTITAIAKRKPQYFVMRDNSMATDNVADNFDQIFRAYSPDTICRIL